MVSHLHFKTIAGILHNHLHNDDLYRSPIAQGRPDDFYGAYTSSPALLRDTANWKDIDKEESFDQQHSPGPDPFLGFG